MKMQKKAKNAGKELKFSIKLGISGYLMGGFS